MRLGVFGISCAVLCCGAAAQGQHKKPAAPANVVKGQKQMAGGPGVFGTVYPLNDGFNFEVIKARYSVEPYNAYETEIAKSDEKFLILTVAIKNASPEDKFFG